MHLLPPHIRKPITNGIIYTLVIGLFSENLSERLRVFLGTGFVKLLFSGKALKPLVALILFFIIVGITIWWDRKGEGVKNAFFICPPEQQTRNRRIGMGLGFGLLLILPILLGSYLSEVTNNVLIYVLMGFGLNIVVGFAGPLGPRLCSLLCYWCLCDGTIDFDRCTRCRWHFILVSNPNLRAGSRYVRDNIRRSSASDAR